VPRVSSIGRCSCAKYTKDIYIYIVPGVSSIGRCYVPSTQRFRDQISLGPLWLPATFVAGSRYTFHLEIPGKEESSARVGMVPTPPFFTLVCENGLDYFLEKHYVSFNPKG